MARMSRWELRTLSACYLLLNDATGSCKASTARPFASNRSTCSNPSVSAASSFSSSAMLRRSCAVCSTTGVGSALRWPSGMALERAAEAGAI